MHSHGPFSSVLRLDVHPHPYLFAGGPLDHANNAPFRGGKHTFWEGGVRTEAFVWSPLLPKARTGTEWGGLAHVSDWFYTYAVGVGSVAMSRARNSGPYADDSVNLWPALMSDDVDAPSPRKEVAHMVHSPQYYPGNCTLSCFSSRNCPAVLTVGDMKIMVGFVGDPRIVPLNFTAGTTASGSPTPVKWGGSGGHCDVIPTSGLAEAAAVLASAEVVAVGGDATWALEKRFLEGEAGAVSFEFDGPDPHCATGIASTKDGVTTCCAKVRCSFLLFALLFLFARILLTHNSFDCRAAKRSAAFAAASTAANTPGGPKTAAAARSANRGGNAMRWDHLASRPPLPGRSPTAARRKVWVGNQRRRKMGCA